MPSCDRTRAGGEKELKPPQHWGLALFMVCWEGRGRACLALPLTHCGPLSKSLPHQASISTWVKWIPKHTPAPRATVGTKCMLPWEATLRSVKSHASAGLCVAVASDDNQSHLGRAGCPSTPHGLLHLLSSSLSKEPTTTSQGTHAQAHTT